VLFANLQLPPLLKCKRAYEAVQTAPEGSIITIDYEFPKPGTTEPVPKQTLETRIGNQGCGVTYYK